MFRMLMSTTLASGGLLFAAALPAAGLEQLRWLAGCWSNPQGEPGSGDYWVAPAGGTMLGVGRLVRDGRTVEYEFLRLHQDASGGVIYTATPSEQAQTAFVASRIDAAGATFENPAHDFPQRITYSRRGTAGMLVRVEGARDDAQRGFTLRFDRVACPDPTTNVGEAGHATGRNGQAKL